MYEDNKGFEIICPFCFHKFPQEHTVFRAHTAYDRSQLEMSDDNDMGGLLGRSSAKKARIIRHLTLTDGLTAYSKKTPICSLMRFSKPQEAAREAAPTAIGDATIRKSDFSRRKEFLPKSIG